MKNHNSINVYSWMSGYLNISGNDLLIFALIYGVAQDGQTEFKGSLNYLCKSINCTKPTAIKSLKILVDKGYLHKKHLLINKVNYCYYTINIEVVNELRKNGNGFLQTRPRTKTPKNKVRQFIFNRDKVCLCCGSSNDITIDHITPVIKGGGNEVSNLQVLCRSCNSKKSDKFKDYRNGRK